jgi:16S rRNA (guanine966-N2)-methyltransferase
MKTRGQVRIIGGQWRGRKIRFPDISGLRPSPDRIRETLFNWLTPYIKAATCLDLFAGSGVLAFESLSRGAKFCVLIDENPKIISSLFQNTKLLRAEEQVQILQGSLPDCLSGKIFPTFNVIFLDPPFRKGYIEFTSHWLEDNFDQFMAKECIIYLESERELDPLPLPNTWQVIKNKKAGQVSYSLAKRL